MFLLELEQQSVTIRSRFPLNITSDLTFDQWNLVTNYTLSFTVNNIKSCDPHTTSSESCLNHSSVNSSSSDLAVSTWPRPSGHVTFIPRGARTSTNLSGRLVGDSVWRAEEAKIYLIIVLARCYRKVSPRAAYQSADKALIRA